MSVPDLLLFNPSAGGGRARKLLDTARAALYDGGVDHRLVTTEGIEHGRVEARAAARAGQRILVMSGDGLIGQVGGELAGTGAVMGILPGGRGNDLARVLGIPNDIEEAAGLIAAGATSRIDVGEVNGARFLCIASCGFDSDANRIANESKRIKGPLVYAFAALRALAAWKPATFALTCGDDRWEVTGYSVAAANSKAYGGGMFVAPEAELDDGLLDLVTVAKVSKLRFLRGLPGVFKGTHTQRAEVDVRRCAEVTIEADRPFDIYADGDHVARLPAKLRVLPAALEVIVPPPGAPGTA